MALTVQTDSGVTGADSYVSVAEAKTIASRRGWTLDGTDAEIESQLLKAMAYLESEYRFKGSRETLETAWPRDLVYVEGFAADPIPENVILAQVLLASKAAAEDILPAEDLTKRFRLEGVFSRENFAPSGSRKIYRDVDAYLAPYIGSQSLLGERG